MAVLSWLGRLRVGADDVVLNFPVNVQFDGYSCGYQSLSSILRYYEVDCEGAEVKELMGLTEDGSDEDGIRRVLRRQRLGWRTFETGTHRRLHGAIDRGHPVLVAVNNDNHWSVVFGYGPEHLFVMDPSIGRALRHLGKVQRDGFLSRWAGWGMEISPPSRTRRRVAPARESQKRATTRDRNRLPIQKVH